MGVKRRCSQGVVARDALAEEVGGRPRLLTALGVKRRRSHLLRSVAFVLRVDCGGDAELEVRAPVGVARRHEGGEGGAVPCV